MARLNPIAGGTPAQLPVVGGCDSPISAPATPNPDAITATGDNYRFVGNDLQLRNVTTGQWQTLAIFGAAGEESVQATTAPFS